MALMATSRPYSVSGPHLSQPGPNFEWIADEIKAIDVSANLHNKVTKGMLILAFTKTTTPLTSPSPSRQDTQRPPRAEPHHVQSIRSILPTSPHTNLPSSPSHPFETGKQSIYHALQSPTDTLTPDVLSAMDTEVSALRVRIAALKCDEKALKADLAALSASMSTPELQASVAALEAQRVELMGRLDPLREGVGKPVEKEEREAAKRDVRVWRLRAQARRRACEELWGFIGEGLPEGKTGEELWVGSGRESTW